MDIYERALEQHRQSRGKIEVRSRMRLDSTDDRVVFSAMDGPSLDIWVKDLPDGRVERITPTDGEGEDERMPRWAPDEQSVTFAGVNDAFFSQRVDGTGGDRVGQQRAGVWRYFHLYPGG